MSRQIQLDGQTGRLDKVLTQLTGESRSLIQRHLQQQFILVNGKAEKANYRLQGDELIELVESFEKPEPLMITPQPIEFEIIYEDEAILIVNKPSGLVVHPSKGHPDQTLANGLVYYLHDQLSSEGESYRPGIVHRIDKDTSGLLVVAKTNQAHRILSQAIQDKQLSRSYLALVQGQVGPDRGMIDTPIRRHPTQRTRFEVHSVGKSALTEFEVMTRYSENTLLKVNLITGRTHQIRVHLEYIKHPIVNDPIYFGPHFKEDLSIDSSFGQLLHAYELSLIHPMTNEPMTFQAPLPKEFQQYIDQLD
ncbi:RluA family pseudouridine synthase [Dolosicoccus paucivorans]|uniref:RluA family pseudouridine synthase n=1 Tax=Dolosicoccus paucivorans TaxID=84521 RepID=UPI000C808CDB|nr:RluA family pseudouridine synthase [Dolosicoccus paucivorans]PMB85144.1 RluA family pseudouridine synthase [Dolosicoccus paucivorans]